MSFKIQNEVAYINGRTGEYDQVQNLHVRYGRNAMSNNRKYLEQLSHIPSTSRELTDFDYEQLKKDLENLDQKEIPESLKRLDVLIDDEYGKSEQITPQHFQLRYIPDGKMNKLALLGAAFENFRGRVSVSVKSFNTALRTALGKNVTVEAFDVNNDQKIDITENAMMFLVKDMLDKGKNLFLNNIDGVYTDKGEKQSFKFFRKDNLQENKQVIKNLYRHFQLDKLLKTFNPE